MSISVKRYELSCTVRDMRLSKCSIIIIKDMWKQFHECDLPNVDTCVLDVEHLRMDEAIITLSHVFYSIASNNICSMVNIIHDI